MQIPNEQLLPGDILFVAGKGLTAKLIKLGQTGIKAISKDMFIPTHVGLVISNAGLIIESTPKNDVDVSGIHKYIANRMYDDQILLFRNINFEKLVYMNPELQDEYSGVFTVNWREKYNYGVLAKIKTSGKKFCSELVFDCLKRAHIISDDTDPSKIHPYNLLKIFLNSKEWRIVDAAAMLTLNREKINSFFDEQVQKQLSTINNLKSIIKKIKNINEARKIIADSEQIPEIRDKLNIALNVESLIPVLEKTFRSLNETISDIQKIRESKLQNEQSLRGKFERLIDTERNWLLLHSATKEKK